MIRNTRPILDKYRLDRLVVPHIDPRSGRPKPGFETVAECVAEDQARRPGATRDPGPHTRERQRPNSR
jgi:hypothetical protein